MAGNAMAFFGRLEIPFQGFDISPLALGGLSYLGHYTYIIDYLNSGNLLVVLFGLPRAASGKLHNPRRKRKPVAETMLLMVASSAPLRHVTRYVYRYNSC
jgi:hypothetical protein